MEKGIGSPMSIQELYSFNNETIQIADKIYREYQRVFMTAESNSGKFSGLMSMVFYPVLLELELFYNGELISSYATFKALYNQGSNYRLVAFHFENLAFRIIAFWEYLYQFVNQYLKLQLYAPKAKQRLIELAGYNMKFVSCENGKKPELEPKSQEETKKARSYLGSTIRHITQNNIVNFTYSRYEVKGYIEKLMNIICNNKIERVKEIRNQIIHLRPA